MAINDPIARAVVAIRKHEEDFGGINDREIDLTSEGKFSQSRNHPLNRNSRGGILSWGDVDVPWNRHGLGYGRYQKRTKGDYHSDEMQMLVRRTSDGDWFLGDYMGWDANRRRWLMEDYCFNECGVIPGTVVSQCMRCGKPRIIPSERMLYMDECDNCQTDLNAEQTERKLFSDKPSDYIPEGLIPWERFVRDEHGIRGWWQSRFGRR